MKRGRCAPSSFLRAPSMGALEEETLNSLLSNGMYNELDKELEKRGHKLERYADDCMTYK